MTAPKLGGCEGGLHGARCKLIRVLLERCAAGDGLRHLERDYGLCRGTLEPIRHIRAKAIRLSRARKERKR
jgi:hypothetical protein